MRHTGQGVFGDNGKGVEELHGLSGLMDVQMGTFGKALGSFGAFALADSLTIDYLINRARTFTYTTALPASALAAARSALQLISGNGSLKKELWENIRYMRQGLLHLGFDLKQSEGPIVPIVVGEDSKAIRIQKMLLEKGVFLQAIRPPTVPAGTSRLRLTIVRGLTEGRYGRGAGSAAASGKRSGVDIGFSGLSCFFGLSGCKTETEKPRRTLSEGLRAIETATEGDASF